MFDFSSQSFVKKQNSDNFLDVQKVRKDLIGEIEAVMEYDQNIFDSNNMTAKQVWKHIKEEELHHIGELLALLAFLDPSQKMFVEKGFQEFNEMQNNL